MHSLSNRWTRGLRGAVLITLCASLCTSATPGAAVAADKQANALEMKARESFAAGRYDEALQTFAKLYAETLHPVYLRNIGRCHQKMREPQKAIDAFQDYLAKTKTGKDKITADERAEIDGYIKDMQAMVDADKAAHVAPPPPVAPVVPVAPAPVTPIQPGPGVTQAPLYAAPLPTATDPNAPGAAPAISTTPAEESPPIYKRWWFWAGVTAVVAAAIIIPVVVASSGSTRDACPSGVTCAK
jgi:hypothetical protein